MDKIIDITESAQKYLAKLLGNQKEKNTGIRIFVQNPGTPKAETCLSYCKPGDHNEDDILLEYTVFTTHVDKKSVSYLKESYVDYTENEMGGQLTIKAPNARVSNIDENSTLEERVNYSLWNDVNPMLASHGGEVSLESLTEDNIAILRFGGGCQGCSAVDMTLKDGVEKTLMEKVPELNGVKDATDHSDRSTAFY